MTQQMLNKKCHARTIYNPTEIQHVLFTLASN